MPTKDKRIDAYVDNAASFAKPILTHIRQVVHEACPDCEETLKWGHPSFMYNGIMCGMAAFKEYCAFHFWKGALIIENATGDQMWGQLGRLTKVSDLPPKKTLAGYVKKAVELNELGTKVPKRPTKPKKELAMPEPFMAAIKKNKKALTGFEAFSPSHKREYIEWITDAKGEDTRARRIAQAVEWMAEGKPRNWKYM
jgi:uncharacterized protein YdeI (YjbR/CyaY-like superfamily)